MKTICLLWVLILSWNTITNAQNVRTITNLPNTLSENSGMLISNENAIWLHNDGGDSAKLYLIDTFGTVLRTILINNATNVDWEDMTYDNQGYVYIGDFGNNGNARQDLKVYKIPHPDSIVGAVVSAEIIAYSYPEQLAFPPPNGEKKYDTEAVVYFQDSLYLFTKDRTSPHLGYTWLYQIPADTGVHAAVLLDSFRTNQISFIFEVTGAALSPNQDQLALLGANRIWLFSNFNGHRFFDGTIQTISLNSISQKEALDFVDTSRIYFSNEASFFGVPQLRELNFAGLLVNNALIASSNAINNLVAYPNPVNDYLYLEFNLKETAKVSVKLLDLNGKCVQKIARQQLNAGEQLVALSIKEHAIGTYFVNLNCGGKSYFKRVVVLR